MKSKKLTGAWGMLSDQLDEEQIEQPQAEETQPNKPVSKRPTPPPRKPVEKKAAGEDELIRIDPNRVRNWAYNDREDSDLDNKDFEELMQSIARSGQIEPIMVRPIKHKDYDYEQLVGFRRLNACRALGIPVLALVRKIDDRKGFVSQIAENDQSSAPPYWRRAQSLNKAMDENLFPSMDAMSIDIGIARSTIANYIRVAKYMPEIFQKRLPLSRCSRDALFFLLELRYKPESLLDDWLTNGKTLWIYSENISKEDIEKSFSQFQKKEVEVEPTKRIKKDGAKTYTGKAGKLFSITRKGEQVTINILKDGKRIMTDDEIADAIVKIMDEKADE